MIVHLLKLVWSRKGLHALVMLEVLCAFLVVFTLVAIAATLLGRYQMPLGYEWRDVWVVRVSRHAAEAEWSAADADTFDRLLREVRSMDGVEQVALASNAPYRTSISIEGWSRSTGARADTEIMLGSPELAEVLRIELVAGRWFEEADRSRAWVPVVIDRALARELFGDADPLDQQIEGESRDRARRVVGVIDRFRRAGEFEAPRPFAFYPAWPEAGSDRPADSLLIRVVPGTSAAFEEPLVERLQNVAHGWTFNVRPLATERESRLDGWLVPLVVAGLVGGFLLLMVVLGLIGVMWQNVTRRTPEIGLRRAAGAWRKDVHWQIVVEVMLIAGFGVAAGTLIAIQAPLLDGSGFMTFPITLLSVIVSAVFILALAALCGLYPGWTATRIQPAQALHYE